MQSYLVKMENDQTTQNLVSDMDDAYNFQCNCTGKIVRRGNIILQFFICSHGLCIADYLY